MATRRLNDVGIQIISVCNQYLHYLHLKTVISSDKVKNYSNHLI